MLKRISCIFTILMIINMIILSCEAKSPLKPSEISGREWPFFRGSAELTGSSASSLPRQLKLVWRFETQDSTKSSPVIRDNALFIGSDDGKLYKLKAKDGSLIWAFTAQASIEAAPLVLDDVYVGDLSGMFYRLDKASAQVKWKYQTGSQIIGAANFYNQSAADTPRLIIGSYDNKIHCIDSKSGLALWTYQTGNYINGTPAVSKAKIITGGCDAFLYVVSAVSGTELLKIDTGSYIAGSPVVLNNHAYIANYGGRLLCVDIDTQKTVWQFNEPDAVPFYSSPAVNEEKLVIGSRNGKLYCFDRKKGNMLWTFTTGDEINCSPVICGEQVVFGSDDGYLYLLELKDGGEIWSYFIGEGVNGSPAVAYNMLFIGAGDGAVYAFGDRGAAGNSRGLSGNMQ